MPEGRDTAVEVVRMQKNVMGREAWSYLKKIPATPKV